MFLSCCMSCLTANAQWSLKDVLNKETVGNLAGSLISLKVTAADLAGTWAYSKPGETGQISLKYGAVEGLAGAGSLNLYVRKTGDRIRLLFKADKLLEIVSAVANMTQNATVNAIGKVASAYDGMLLGCELTPKE